MDNARADLQAYDPEKRDIEAGRAHHHSRLETGVASDQLTAYSAPSSDVIGLFDWPACDSSTERSFAP